MGGLVNTAANLGSPFRGANTGGSVGNSVESIVAPHTASAAKKEAPPPPDYMGAVNRMGEISKDLLHQQTQANRPNQSSPFANSQWNEDANGNWTQTTGFNGPFAGISNSLQQQAAQNMSQPMDWGQFGTAMNGDQARDQAINAAYGQATSRLDPQWKQREEAQRTQLLNQGLTPGSEAYNQEMGSLGMQRNDAYTSAMNGAIGQGTMAGDVAFRNNQMARQNAIADALRQRGQPMQELQGMQSFLGMPGFNAGGRADTPNYLGAAQAGGDYGMNAFAASNSARSDAMGGLMQAVAAMFSDERAKTDIVRLPEEAMPGVPFATWKWKPEFAGSGPEFGVIAQDLERVAPQYVFRGPGGIRMVDYSFLRAG